ncbi:MAG: hypothetical protein KJO33_04470 [Gammaproteobacteria bacterium]|nr:hypothetical protein [Gammaproteobacteria bacterium]
MTIAALELNDQSLLIQAEDGSLHAEPGFARLTPDGIETGEEARAVAWREPQHVYDQYWRQLNQTPLPIRHPHARHHADIAFAQLRKLWQNAGAPESLVILAPGSFAEAPLSLLLGMAAALPAQVSAVIDSALAACADAKRDTLYVDLQMHESVLTVCRSRGDSIAIEEQEVFPGLGMAQIQNALARHISDLIIASYRIDPLHSSETEQAIFDEIPHWLNRLRWEGDVPVKLRSEQGEQACILNREAIRALIGDRLASVRTFIDKWRDCERRLSHGSGLLTGLVSEFSEAEVVGQTVGTHYCLSRSEELAEPGGELRRLSELRRPEAIEVPAGNGERLATHLLCGDLALPLDRPVSIRVADEGARISSDWDEEAAITVVMRDRRLETLQGGGDAALPSDCLPGEAIRLGRHEFRLIRVGGE